MYISKEFIYLFIVNFSLYSIYSYPVDACCSSHYARDNIKSYIFFCALSSMENIAASTLALVGSPSRDGVSIKILAWRHLKPKAQLL